MTAKRSPMASAWPMFQAQDATNGDSPGWGAPSVDAPKSFTPSPLATPKAIVGEGKRLRLERGPQIRREMVRVYRGMKAGEIDVTKGTKLIYALTEMSRALEREKVEALTDRLDAAEDK